MGGNIRSMLEGLGDAFSMKFGENSVPGSGYTSGDGLVNIPGLSKEDALNGFRSVIDFRHLYGPDTNVPNIRHGDELYSGKLPSNVIESDSGPGPYRNSQFEDGSTDPVKKNSFFKSFSKNLSDQLFQRAMMGFMGRGPY